MIEEKKLKEKSPEIMLSHLHLLQRICRGTNSQKIKNLVKQEMWSLLVFMSKVKKELLPQIRLNDLDKLDKIREEFRYNFQDDDYQEACFELFQFFIQRDLKEDFYVTPVRKTRRDTPTYHQQKRGITHV